VVLKEKQVSHLNRISVDACKDSDPSMNYRFVQPPKASALISGRAKARAELAELSLTASL
jgi:hypothetical protein